MRETVLSATWAFTSPMNVNTVPRAAQVLKSSSMATMNAVRVSRVRSMSARVSSGEGTSCACSIAQSRPRTAFSMRTSAASASARRSSEKSSGLR